jgi:hypothetical protein
VFGVQCSGSVMMVMFIFFIRVRVVGTLMGTRKEDVGDWLYTAFVARRQKLHLS